jgi:hypothetical protein
MDGGQGAWIGATLVRAIRLASAGLTSFVHGGSSVVAPLAGGIGYMGAF